MKYNQLNSTNQIKYHDEINARFSGKENQGRSLQKLIQPYNIKYK